MQFINTMGLIPLKRESHREKCKFGDLIGYFHGKNLCESVFLELKSAYFVTISVVSSKIYATGLSISKSRTLPDAITNVILAVRGLARFK